jgi:hypothetical protein
MCFLVNDVCKLKIIENGNKGGYRPKKCGRIPADHVSLIFHIKPKQMDTPKPENKIVMLETE